MTYVGGTDEFFAAVEALAGSLGERVPAADRALVEDAVDGGEWTEALEALPAGLGRHGTALTTAEKTELGELFRAAGADVDLASRRGSG